MRAMQLSHSAQSKKLRYLPHWGDGIAKKFGSVSLTAVLVLSNLLTGLSPAIAYAEEMDQAECR